MKEDIYIFGQYNDPQKSFNVIMAGISYCDETYRIERPEYPYFVIEHIIDGTGILETAGNRYEMHGGDTYFLYKGTAHTYYCKKDHLWNKLWIVVDGPLVDALLTAYLPSAPDWLQGFDIRDYMENALALAQEKNLDYPELLHQMALIVHKILIAADWFQQKKSISFHEILKKHIDENLFNPFNLEEISERFHYSKNHIINLFKKQYGVTPYKYYADQRMLIAKDLLLHTSLSVSEISNRLQFDTPQYFSKCFKKHFGTTPFYERLQTQHKETGK